jgi:hypothetical protein
MAGNDGSDPRSNGRATGPTPGAGSSRPKTPIDQWFEVLVYAPLGFVLDARQLFPRFVDRGRNQVVLAKVIGKYAVEHGADRAGEYVGQSHEQVAAVLQALGILPDEPEPPSPRSAPARTADADPEPVAPERPTRPARSAPTAARRSPARRSRPAAVRAAEPAPAPAAERTPEAVAAGPVEDAPVVDVASLAIPDYDNLSASQVVPRLGGLSAPELEAVRRYEAAQRGRKTILGKIAQLQSA